MTSLKLTYSCLSAILISCILCIPAFALDVGEKLTDYDEVRYMESSGDIVIVGAYASSQLKGAVFVHRLENGELVQLAKLTTESDETANNTHFGFAVDISDDVIVVGAPKSDAVYVFEKPDGGWVDMTETHKIDTPFLSNGWFGFSLSLKDNLLSVGAYRLDSYEGAVTVYKKSFGEKWSDNNYIYKNISAPVEGGNQYFGHEVRLHGETLVVGNIGNNNWTGAVRVYDELFSKLEKDEKILPTATLTTSNSSYQLGMHVAINGNTIVATDYGRNNAGRVVVFNKSTQGWEDATESYFITNEEIVNGSHFGSDLDITSDKLLIGASQHLGKGKVYLYGFDNEKNTGVTLINSYQLEDGASNDFFGSAVKILGEYVAINSMYNPRQKVYLFKEKESNISLYTKSRHLDVDGDVMVLGTYEGESNIPGSAFVYEFQNGEWEEVAQLSSSDGVNGDMFGFAVAISGDEIIVGSPETDKVYIYEKPAEGWSDMTESYQITNPLGDGYFGFSVDILNGRAVVGAYRQNHYEGRGFYIERLKESWSEGVNITTLKSPSPKTNEYFSHQIRISKDAILVGALGKDNWKGTAYIYNLLEGGFISETVEPDVELTHPTGRGHQFGIHLDLSTDLIAITDYQTSNIDGEVIIYKRENGAIWTSDITGFIVNNPTGKLNEGFGSDVQVSDNKLLIGAYTVDGHGSTHLFTLNPSSSSSNYIKSYTPDPRNYNMRFGTGVRFHDSHIVVLAENNPEKFFFTFFDEILDHSNYTKSRYLDVDGDVMVLGTYEGENNIPGSAFVYEFKNGDWEEVAQLSSSDGVDGDMFGFAVAISGDEIIVGSPETDKVYIYEKPAEGWSDMTESYQITNPLGEGYFGFSVDIYNGSAVIGAYQQNNYEGRGFFIKKRNDSWTGGYDITTLTSPKPVSNEYFGHQIRISKNAILVGALGKDNWKGTAYVYNLPSNGFIDAVETPSVELQHPNNRGHQFGIHLDLNDDMIAVTDYKTDNIDGEVVIYHRPKKELWSSDLKGYVVSNPTGNNGESFGSDVQVKGDTLLVGAFRADVHGSTHLFLLCNDSMSAEWKETFIPEEIESEIRFGTAVRFHESHFVVLAEDNPDQFYFLYGYPNLMVLSNAVKNLNKIEILNTDPRLRNENTVMVKGLSEGVFQYHIYNGKGSKLHSGEITPSNNDISLEGLEKGLLYIVLSSDVLEAVHTFKVLN
ncbi:FG-GAP repeat protein [Flammeovirga sp. SubArs3]|uniref:FG-GAP repeat protein n=1 Tax=Flammeovirga sp. SubArs3 TaxID=2995316 RepID=UPI00248C0EDD|nr:FG-GAP repeat protein [Flammeovirga sp. SubArs3]